MQSKGVRGAVFGAIAAAAMLLAGAAQAALQDRDLDKNGVTDAFFDTDLKITWLRDANVNGVMSWDTAVAWAVGYTFGGYSDWRLPTSDTCTGNNCTGSEMGHLWYTELGNSAGGPMGNKGDFENLQPATYWSSKELNPSWVYAFYMVAGSQGHQPKSNGPIYSMAVRNGDVAAVPEPATYALMLVGLGALALAKRRQQR